LTGSSGLETVPRSRPLPREFGLYLVTDRHQTRGRPLVECVEAALRGGVRAVQLREKDLSARELMELGGRLRKLTVRHEAALLINDRIDVAMACDADGVHLAASSFDVCDARALLGPDRIVGVSTHAPEQVIAAEQAGADFVVFGPVFDTPSKRGYGPPLGLAALTHAASAVAIPVLAIGGITADRVHEVRAAGAAGVAVIRAILAAEDPEAAARAFASGETR
jgi:thiamine-phosphate pyrophosphorylase